MGGEAVYKVTLLEEAVERKDEPAEVVPAAPDDEGGDAGDVDDSFAMMSCMGEEAIYTVTLIEEALERQEEPAEVVPAAPAEVGEAAGDVDDSDPVADCSLYHSEAADALMRVHADHRRA